MKTRDELVQLAADLYAKLGSGNAVARRLDVSHSTAYRLLAAAGVVLPDRHSPEVQQRKKKLHGKVAKSAAQDYANGMSASVLEKKYHASMWAIRTAVKDAGLPMRSRGGRYKAFSDIAHAEAARLYEDGWSQAEIAAKFGSGQAVVSRLLRSAKVQTRDRGARGQAHGMWKGGRVKTSSGYVAIWVAADDPMSAMSNSTSYVLEHRLVMARSLGRPLLPHETVHHINGKKNDNRLENLELRQGKHGKHMVMCCLECGSRNIGYVGLQQETAEI